MAGKQFQLISLGIAATHAPHAKSTVKWASTAAWHEMSQDKPDTRSSSDEELHSASAWPHAFLLSVQLSLSASVCLIPKHGKFKLQPARAETEANWLQHLLWA